MPYRIDDHHHGNGLPGQLGHYPTSNVQKLTTRNDIYWDGETTFDIAFPCFYVEARDFAPHTVRERNKQDHWGWPSPNWPDGSDQKRVDWREKETLHARHLGEYHDGVQFMPTPYGMACTGRHHVCHDYAPRGRHRKERICVNCLHHVIPIQLWDEFYRKGEMRIYSLPHRHIHEEHGHERYNETITDVTIGEQPRFPGHDRLHQHIVRVHLAESKSEMDMANLELWYDLKIRAPYVYYTPGPQRPDGSYAEGTKHETDVYDGQFIPPPGSRIIFRPRTDTVAKGRMHMNPSVINRVAW